MNIILRIVSILALLAAYAVLTIWDYKFDTIGVALAVTVLLGAVLNLFVLVSSKSIFPEMFEDDEVIGDL